MITEELNFREDIGGITRSAAALERLGDKTGEVLGAFQNKTEAAREAMVDFDKAAQKAARGGVDKARKSAEGYGKSLLGVTARLRAAGADAGQFAVAQEQVGESIKKQQAEVQKQRKELLELQQTYASLGKTSGKETAGLKADLEDLTSAIKSSEDSIGLLGLEYIGLGDAQKKAAKEAGNLSKPIRLSANEATNLSFQLNDTFVSIGSGSGILRTLIQQGPQVTQIFGGLGNTFRFMGQQALAAVKSVFTLRGALSLLGKVGILLVITTIVTALVELDKRTKVITDTFAGLGKAMGVLTDRLSGIAKGFGQIFSGNPSEGFATIGKNVTGLGGALSQAARDGFNLSQSLRQIQKDLRDLDVIQAGQQQRLNELIRLRDNEKKGLQERIDAENEFADTVTNTLDKQIVAEERKLAGTLTGTTRVTAAVLDQIAQIEREGVSAIETLAGVRADDEALTGLADQVKALADLKAQRDDEEFDREVQIEALRKEAYEKYLERVAKQKQLEEDLAKIRQDIAEKLRKLQERNLEGEEQIEAARRVAQAEIDELERVTRAVFAEAKKQFDLEADFALLRSETNAAAEEEKVEYRIQANKELIDAERDRQLAEIELLTGSLDETLNFEEFKAKERARIQRESLQELRRILVDEFGPDSVQVLEIDVQIKGTEEAGVQATVDAQNRIREEFLKTAEQRKAIRLGQINNLQKSLDKELTLENFQKRERLRIEQEFAEARLKVLETRLDDNLTEQEFQDLQVEIELARLRLSELRSDLNQDFELRGLARINQELMDAFNLDAGQLAALKQQVGTIVPNVLAGINALNEAKIAGYDRLLAMLDERIADTQSKLDEELALRRDGFANDAALYEEKLKKDQAAREKASKAKIALEKKAAKQQLAIDAAQQASSLALAAVQIFTAETRNKGIIGVALAVAGIAAMFALVAKYRAQAKDIGGDIPSFRQGGKLEGGVIVGPSHEAGGVMVRDRRQRLYEVEGGEYIVPLTATKRYEGALDAMKTGKLDKMSDADALRALGRKASTEGTDRVGKKARANVDYSRPASDVTLDALSELLGEHGASIVGAITGKPTYVKNDDGSLLEIKQTGTKISRKTMR